jgi:hypothetical protein
VADDPPAVTAAAQLATELAAGTGLSPAGAAIVAVIDAMERAQWPTVPLDALLAGTPHLDRSELERELAVLVAARIIDDTSGGLRLDAGARELLGGGTLELPARSRVVPGQGRGHADLARLLGRPRAAVVVTGGTPDDRLAAIEQASASPIVVMTAPSATNARDIWLRDGLIAVEAGEQVAWLAAVAAMPVRFAVGVAERRAGELLALARLGGREPQLWRVPASEPRQRAPVPDVLEPLIVSVWNGVRVAGCPYRVAGLRGSPARLAAAGPALAAGLGGRCAEVAVDMPGGTVRARDAFAARPGVVVLVGCARLDAIRAHAIAALISSAPPLVAVIVDGELPEIIAQQLELVVDIG